MTQPSVRQLKFAPDFEVVPHAIFWRPLAYFTGDVREGEDGLDLYLAASFAIGNEIKFDLRVYRAHHNHTTTLYLSEEVTDDKQIRHIVDTVIQAMLIPLTAVGWRRGQPFEFGQVNEPLEHRLQEKEARVLVLKIAARQPNRFASTAFLKKEVPHHVYLSPRDRVQSPSRPNEVLWQQVVGNVISHHASKAGPFQQGLATRSGDGLTVTDAGMAYLNNIGFNVVTPAG